MIGSVHSRWPGRAAGTWSCLLALLSALVVVAPVARAQGPSAQVSISSDRVAVGDFVDLLIIVEGASNATVPDLSVIEGATAEFVGGSDRSSQSVTIINGRRSEQRSLAYIMQWRLTPTRPGIIEIPALRFSAGGQEVRTDSLRFEAVEPGTSPDFGLEFTLSTAEAWVGEPIRATLVWTLEREPRNPTFRGLNIDPSLEVHPLEDADAIAGGDPRVPILNVLGLRVVGRIIEAERDGRRMTGVRMEWMMVPTRPGTFDVGAIVAAFDAVTGTRRRGALDSIFADPSRTERVVIRSGSPTLTVRELPTEGRPAGFSGLVGTYGIESSLSPTSASVGDPLTLTVRITGPEPLTRATPPNLEIEPGVADAFRLSPDGWEQAKAGRGERVFTTTIRPLRADVSEFPALSLPSFDPRTRKYTTAASTPIPLEIRATRELTLSDAVGTIPQPDAGQRRTPEIDPDRPAGIHANVVGPALLGGAPHWLDAGSTRGWMIAGAVAVPPGVALLAAWWGRRRDAGSSRASAWARSLVKAAQRVERAGDAAEARRLIAEAVAAPLGVLPAAVASEDLRRWSSPSAAPLADALAELERAAHGEPVADLASSLGRAGQAMRALAAGGIR